MPDGDRIGSGYIEIYGEVNASQMRMAAADAGKQFGIGFGKELDGQMIRIAKDTASNFSNSLGNNLKSGAGAKAAKAVGRTMGEALEEGIEASIRPILASFPGRVAEILATPIGPALIAVGTPLITAAGITLGAALGGSILAGLGAVSFGGGLAVALMNPETKAAAVELGKFIGNQLSDAAVPFRKELIGSFGIIQQAMDSFDFQSALDRLAPISTLFANMFQDVAPQLNQIIQEITFLARPFAEITADFVRKLIPAVDRFIDKLGGSLPGLQAGFIFLGNVIISVMDFTGDLLAHLGRMFAQMTEVGANFLDILAAWVSGLERIGIKLGITSGELHNMATNMRNTLIVGGDLNSEFQSLSSNGLTAMGDKVAEGVVGYRELKAAMSDVINPTRDLNEATEAFNASQLRLLETETRFTDALSINTEVGLRNRDMVERSVELSRELALAEIAAGASVEEATRKHEDRINKLIDENFQSEVTREEARKLAEQYGQIPTDIVTQIQASGADDVQATLESLRVKQVSLWKNISEEEAKRNIEKGTYHTGGLVSGTRGSEGTALLKGKEYVMQQSAVDRYGLAFMNMVNRGLLPQGIGQRSVGGPSITAPFPVNVSDTLVDEDWAKGPAAAFFANAGAAFAGPGSLGAHGSGVPAIIALAAASGIPFYVSSSYRNTPDWHGAGRAVDFGGYNQDRLAGYFMGFAGSLLELIHQSNGRIYDVKNGVVNSGVYGSLFSAGDDSTNHSNHLHVAMDRGGALAAKSGTFIRNNLGKPEAVLNPQHSAFVGRVLSGEALNVENHLTIEIDGEFIEARIKKSQAKVITALSNGRR